MDGRGRALDNIFVERLWRTVKYENIYMNDYQTMPINHCHQIHKPLSHWDVSNISTPDLIYLINHHATQ
jgi:hypothetical protein